MTRYGGAALVTGASAGIGEAFARRIAAAGVDLVLVARRKDRLDALAGELAARHGIRAHVVALDLTAPDALPRLRAATEAIPIGLLVLNAGFGAPGALHLADPAVLDAMVTLHCAVPVRLAHAYLPAMIARRTGAVIVVASVAGFQLSPGSATYAASKGFDLLLGESLWAELRPLGIDALAVSPGYTKSEFHDSMGRPPVPAWAWSTADDVAREALAGLGRTGSVVVGWRYRMLCLALRLLPRSWLLRLAGPIFFRKLGRLPADDHGRSGG